MIELVDHRRSDDALNIATYLVVLAHVGIVTIRHNTALAELPGGSVTVIIWAVLVTMGSLVSIIGVVLRLLDLEKAGLTLLSSCMFAYGLSGLVIEGSERTYPGLGTSVLALALTLVFVHHAFKIRRHQRNTDTIMSTLQSEVEARGDSVEEAGE